MRLNQHLAVSSFGVSGERMLHGGPQSYKIRGTSYFRLLPPSFSSKHVPLAWHLCAGIYAKKQESEAAFRAKIPNYDMIV